MPSYEWACAVQRGGSGRQTAGGDKEWRCCFCYSASEALHKKPAQQPAHAACAGLAFCLQKHLLACGYNGIIKEQSNQFAISLGMHEQVLCGIGDTGGHVHFMFVYRDPFSDAGYDDKISLSYKLPVLQENDP